MPFGDYSDVQDNGLVAGQAFKVTVGGTPVSMINGGAAVIPAGFGVVYGATQQEVTLPSGAGVFAGIAALPHTIEVRGTGLDYSSLDADGRFGYPVDFEVAVASTDMWAVWVDDTVAQGDPVYLNHTASTSLVGAFRNDANTAAAQQINGAVFVTAATGTPGAPAVAVIHFQ